MLTQALKEQIFRFQKEHILLEEPMKNHTSFQIGGPAELFIEPESEEIFGRLLTFLKRESVPFVVIGAGSNLLVGDRGVRGVVVKTGKAFDFLERRENIITAGSGVTLAKLSSFAAQAGLSGLEFASGIPGLVGGALYMNAGAYGGEMKDVVRRTYYYNEDGEKKTVEGADHQFGYRSSIFTEGGKYIVSTEMELSPKSEDEIRLQMLELNRRRKEKQPLSYPSAGSTFKRPEGYFAAKLIEDAGLKGASVGGARVSEKHSGFIINQTGAATAADVCALIDKVKETVFRKFGVELQCEIKKIGDF